MRTLLESSKKRINLIIKIKKIRANGNLMPFYEVRI